MKKIIRTEKSAYECDTCGTDLPKEFLGVPITVNFGYGSPLDGLEAHFCDFKCVNLFFIGELKKQLTGENENE